MANINDLRLLNKYTPKNEKSFTFNEIFYDIDDETADPADYIRINAKAVLIA